MLSEWISLISQVAGTLVVGLLAYGLWHRRRPRIHMPVMKACFITDLANVALIEVSGAFLRGQSAVAKGVDATITGGSPLLVFHIAVSLLVLVGYGVAWVTGRRLHRTGRGRRTHRINACVFIPVRLANWVTSFMV